MDKLTDAEVCCTFMEPRPELPDRYFHLTESPKHWWVLIPIRGGGMVWFPRGLDLDDCRDIEVRLPNEQRLPYWLSLSVGGPPEQGYWRVVNADAERKVAALAVVLRPIVEGQSR